LNVEHVTIVQWLGQCITDRCQRSVGQSDFELAVYLMFYIFNLGRVFTYYPTIRKLRTPGCTGDGQSVWTWITWTLANGTLALHVYVVSAYQSNDLVWLNLANMVMCCICLWYLVKAQRRAGTLGWVPFRKPRAGYVVTVQLSDDLRHPMARQAHSAGQPLNAVVAEALRQYLGQAAGGMPPAASSKT
jgi:TRAP-type uncharacterized transport system fused permease subunit